MPKRPLTRRARSRLRISATARCRSLRLADTIPAVVRELVGGTGRAPRAGSTRCAWNTPSAAWDPGSAPIAGYVGQARRDKGINSTRAELTVPNRSQLFHFKDMNVSLSRRTGGRNLTWVKEQTSRLWDRRLTPAGTLPPPGGLGDNWLRGLANSRSVAVRT